MRIQWRGNAAFLLGLLSCLTADHVSASAFTETRQALDACVEQLFVRQETVYQDDPVRLDRACPDLNALLGNEVLTQLQPPLEQETTFAQLHDAQRSLASFTPRESTGHLMVDRNGLTALLEDVYEPYVKPEIPPNPIDEFWTWVGEKLREYLSEDNWLTRNFDISPSSDKDFLEGLKNTVIVILIVLVLYVLISELRAANLFGLLKRRRGRSERIALANTGLDQKPVQNLADISSLPLKQQVPALLRYAIHYLVERQLLPRQYSLTNREFLELVRKNLPDVAREFEVLVDNGERVLYGNKLLPAGDAVKLIDHVKKIQHVPGRDRP